MMSKFTKGKSKKFIIVILICVILTTTFPIPVNADVGGSLLKPISQLICKIGDLVLKFLQKTFIGYGDIGIENPADTKTYSIYYSPAVIFSGQVAALDVNFINPLGDEGEVKQNIKKHEFELIANSISVEDLEDYGFNIDTANYNHEKEGWFRRLIKIGTNAIYYTWTDEATGTEYFYLAYKNIEWKDMAWWQQAVVGGVVTAVGVIGGPLAAAGTYALLSLPDLVDSLDEKGELYKIVETNEIVSKTSIAYQLRNIVSKAFTGMQVFAIVGLLSVLVYISIRIIIGSVQDKSKYKQMLMDWLTAMCILFVLLYLMVFILSITQKITDILTAETISDDGKDILMSSLRNTVEGTYDFSDVFGETILYLALVVFTCLFTIKYLKRVVYMAFLTMIAPLIALTYPLDKIKDNKAQAFNMWLKEYIFNAMIQPVDYLIYCILVGSSLELISNPIYAVVAIGFLTPAEKFFRKMFGMESKTPVGELGAAAAGATTMNFINKLASGNKKKEKKKEEANPNIRTADRNSPIPITANQGTAYTNGANETQSEENYTRRTNASEIPSEGINASEIPSEGTNTSEALSEEEYTRGRNTATTGLGSTTSSNLAHGSAEISRTDERVNQQTARTTRPRYATDLNAIFRAEVKKPQNNVGAGVKAVASDLGKGAERMAINGAKYLGKTAFKLAGIGTGAAIAIAASATNEDFFNKLGTNLITASSLGNVTEKLGETVVNAPENIDRKIRTSQENRRERLYSEGDYREFFKTREGQELLKQYAQEEIEQCLKEGLRGGKDIEDIVKVSRTLKTRNKNIREPIKKAIAYKHMAESCPKEILKDEKSFGNYLRQNNIPTQNIREIREGISLFQ